MMYHIIPVIEKHLDYQVKGLNGRPCDLPDASEGDIYYCWEVEKEDEKDRGDERCLGEGKGFIETEVLRTLVLQAQSLVVTIHQELDFRDIRHPMEELILINVVVHQGP